MLTNASIPAEGSAHADVERERPTGPILKQWRRYGTSLQGFIYNDPRKRFPDGTWIMTSTVQWINEEAGLAQTLNTLYLLRDKSAQNVRFEQPHGLIARIPRKYVRNLDVKPFRK
jgi:hypothetical protein